MKREEGVVALHLISESLKHTLGVNPVPGCEPVPRFEPSTYQPDVRCLATAPQRPINIIVPLNAPNISLAEQFLFS